MTLLLLFCAGNAPADEVLFGGRLLSAARDVAGREDLDGDGNEDCWSASRDGGSGSGGVVLHVASPCGAEAIEVDTTSSFGEFLGRTPLAPALASRKQLVRGVVDLLYGVKNLRDSSTVDESFRLLLGHPARWTAGRPGSPPSQVVISADPDEMVAYFAHNHGPLEGPLPCGHLDLYHTNHGVAVYDRKREVSSWIWIADHVEKLRWPSITSAACGNKGLVTIETHEGTVTVAPPAR